MSDIVSFKIRVEGSNELKTISVSAEELGGVLDSVTSKAKRLNGELVNAGSWSQILTSASDALVKLDGMMRTLTTAYTSQVEAETLLATAMRNTMGATDEEIDRIKQLTAEQQKIGIVGDEVQLAAAQELATYLELSSSLEAIIPTMNDMIAQQLRLGASAESATQIATMLGKVMNGQTKALSRYGYEFSEAQEYILKFGNESERAAILVDVVGQSVGGANKNTREAVGAYQDMLNTLGDIQEALGKVTYQVQPYVTAFAQVGQAVLGMQQLGTAIKAIIPAQTLATAGSRLYSAGLRMLGISARSAAAGTTATRIAVMALYATITMGASLALQGLIELFGLLGQKGKKAAGEIDDAKDAQKAFVDASKSTRLALAEEIIKLEDLIKHKRDASKEIAHLNSEYGSVFGNHKTAAEWYDTLTQKSAAYAKQLGYEAQAKVYASKKAARELELDAKQSRIKELEQNVNSYNAPYVYGNGGKENPYYFKTDQFKADKAELQRLRGEVKPLEDDIASLGNSFDTCTKKMAEAAEELGTGIERNTPDKKTGKTLVDDLAEYTKSVQGALAAERAFSGEQDEKIAKLNEMDAQLTAMKSGLTSLIAKYGSEEASIRGLILEYKELVRARREAFNEAYSITPLTRQPSFQDSAHASKEYITDKTGKRIKNPTPYSLHAAAPAPTEQARQMYSNLKDQLPGADPKKRAELLSYMKTLSELYDIPEERAAQVEDAANVFGSLADVMGDLGGIVDESTASWLKWGANLLKVISQALPQLATLFTANAAVASTEGAASVAGIPYVGPVLAIAAITSILAAVATIPKFANGALAYGPTIGVFGEYPGASNNPEVVAPLDKLRDLIEPSGAGFGVVEFRMKGRDLVGVAKKVNRLDSRNNG